MSTRTCDGCGTPRGDDSRPSGTWWSFTRYLGKEPHTTPGMSLTGYYCPECAKVIYDEPGGFERTVIKARVSARLSK